MHKLANQTACTVFVMGLMLVGSTGAWAQETGSSGAPPAATGPDTATQTIENPPLSGLDEPSFEPGFGSSSFGGIGGLGGLGGGITSGGGIAGGAGGGLFSNAQFGSIGNQPRITNMSIVDVTQELSPRSSVTLAGGYGLTNFLNNPQGFINSQTTTAQAGYNYKLSRRDQLDVTYGFREFHFPRAGSGSFNTNVWQALSA